MLKGSDFLRNEKLLDLYNRLVQARSSIDSANIKIKKSKDEMDNFYRGYNDYSNNIGIVVPSFLSIHGRKCNESKARYFTDLSDKAKIEKSIDCICKELRQYAIDNCIPLQYRKTAIVSYQPFDNFVAISYCVDEVSKDFVVLKLYINVNEL